MNSPYRYSERFATPPSDSTAFEPKEVRHILGAVIHFSQNLDDGTTPPSLFGGTGAIKPMLRLTIHG
ncbi:MAG: hypothetical protein HC827_22270 [Cyanobacteria bacterium RM1_2_2]|nr:hypothetical protein [Cyanobacteria bacterium RM1_2_2]